jgi:hypothetical protein
MKSLNVRGRIAINLVVVFMMLFTVGPRLRAQETVITNVTVLEMTKLGLDDNAIITKIKSGKCAFQIADSDLAELKKAGISPKVVAAMVAASNPIAARVTIDNKPAEMHSFGPAKDTGRVANIATGTLSTLGTWAAVLGSMGTASTVPPATSIKEKAYLAGAHSSLVVSATPVIEIELPKDEMIDQYVLVRLNGQKDRRELEVGSKHLWTGHLGGRRGIRSDSIVKASSTPLGGNRFRLTVSRPLKKGEYMLYIVDSSAGNIDETLGRGYDFAVGRPEP